MRFTKVLLQLNYYRHAKRIWKKQGKMEVKEFMLPPELQAMAIEIKDAKEIFLENKLFRPPVQTVKVIPQPPSAFVTGSPFYRMHADVKVTENENQALALTKTVPYKGLPQSIISAIGVTNLPNQDELVKNSILQAQVWDAQQEKLPRITLPDRPGYRCKRPYGILNEKKVADTLEKLSFLCDSATGKYADCFERNKIFQAVAEIGIKRNGSNIVFQLPADILMESKTPLKRFSPPADVKATRDQTVPDLYPIRPTLDLEKCSTNPLTDSDIRVQRQASSLHSLFLTTKAVDLWLPSQQLSKAISTCFTFAAVEAQNKFGADVKELPEPISIQCMFMDVKSANMIAYQLNTLHLDDNEGIKNQVWIDQEADFYGSVSELDLVIEFNETIFKKMLALHINGLNNQN